MASLRATIASTFAAWGAAVDAGERYARADVRGGPDDDVDDAAPAPAPAWTEASQSRWLLATLTLLLPYVRTLRDPSVLAMLELAGVDVVGAVAVLFVLWLTLGVAVGGRWSVDLER